MIKGQDILILLKLCDLERGAWRQLDLAISLKLSQSEIAKSLARCTSVGLLIGEKQVSRPALFELLIYGAKFFFPPVLGAPTRGVATAWGVKELFPEIVSQESPVWPFVQGESYGYELQPIYDTVPEVCLSDYGLYQ